MRRALVRKLGWSSTIRTVFPTDVILAHGFLQIYTAGRTPGWQSEPQRAPARTSWTPAIPPGYGDSPLGVWRHARKQPRGGIDHECRPHRYPCTGGPRRTLERSASQEGQLGLAGLRARRAHDARPAP